MSWLNFANLIDDQDTSIANWRNAIDANPNTPEDALKVAILERIVDQRDIAMLEKLCSSIVSIVRQVPQLTQPADEMEDFTYCLCGEQIPSDEYRCMNCKALEEARINEREMWRGPRPF